MDEPVPRGPAVVAGLAAAILVATSARYGYHRDELYFLVAGRHPAWGYDDQPPLTPLLAAGIDHVVPGSLVALRLPSALLTGLTVWLGALTAREMGATRRGQLLAAVLGLVMPFLLVSGHLLSTTVPDVTATAAIAWIAARVVRTGDDRLLLLVGPVLGLALMNKDLVGFAAAALVGAILLVGPRWMLRSWRLWAAAAIALVLWLPYVIWQARHGWPQLEMSREIRDEGAEGGPIGFVPFQLLLVGPPVALVLLAGVWRLLRVEAARPFRFLGVAYLLLVVGFMVLGGKAYYVGGLLPAVMAAGAIATHGWLDRGRADGGWGARVRRGLLAAGLVAGGLTSVLLSLPVLPVSWLHATPIVAVNYDAGETVGWPRLVAQVATAWDTLPPTERSTAVLVTSNYGQAGALERYGPDHGLPHPYSGANALARYGPPPEGAVPVVVVGYDESTLGDRFSGCRLLRRLDNGHDIDNDEQGTPVWRCDGPVGSWSAVWPKVRHLS